ncbi:hypothetical protein DICVIV_09463 [Dictyocaulus viviparus]|uniref:Uncharacterized protein n=1 Tax=Dictyocaulus viviparus TaxID=29172 RepID=A0A0D8XL67_DICVI|nr:hypothetical protein DICVIV_09463 [Dictyocaulus viviparus]
MCSEQAMIVMGPMLLEKLKRLQQPNAHFLQYMQACCSECQKINPGGWGASLPGAIFDPPLVQKPNPNTDRGRSQLNILVDNVVRDLPSFDKHTHLLQSYIEKHPEEAGKLEEYLQELYRAARLKTVGSVTEQQAVSAAQNLFTLRSRFETMRHAGQCPLPISSTIEYSPTGSVLQAKDINAESFTRLASSPWSYNVVFYFTWICAESL